MINFGLIGFVLISNLYSSFFLTSREKSFSERASGKGKDFSLLSIDIDFFKKVNDTFGHPGGDEVIIALAKLLEEKGKPNIVGRVGGEEFMAIIMHDESQSIEEFCVSLRDDVNKLEIPFQDTMININISGGVASSSTTDSWEDMVNLADERLYKSKENGRDQITFD